MCALNIGSLNIYCIYLMQKKLCLSLSRNGQRGKKVKKKLYDVLFFLLYFIVVFAAFIGKEILITKRTFY